MSSVCVDPCRLWDARVPKPSAKVPVTADNFYVAWHPSGNSILVTSKSNCNTAVDLRTQKVLVQKTSPEEVGLTGWHGAVCCLPFLPNFARSRLK